MTLSESEFEIIGLDALPNKRLLKGVIFVACARSVVSLQLVLVLAFISIALSTPLRASEFSELTLERLLGAPALSGTAPSTPVWSPDSKRFAFTWNNQGLPVRALWLADQDGSNLRRLEPLEKSPASIQAFAWTPDATRIISLREGAVWSTSVSKGQSTLLSEVGNGVSDLTVSPDGKQVAYLQGGDVWLLDLQSHKVTAATKVGIAGLSDLPIGRYSRPEREIGPGIWGGPTYAWSPDSKYIAVHYVDRRNLGKVPFPNYLGAETEPNEVRRAYPGDANELRTVGLLRVADGDLRLLDIKSPSSNQIVGFEWSPSGVLLIDQASDTAVDRWLFTVDTQSGNLREVWHSHRPSRVYTTFASSWHPDGKQVVFLSDLGDRYGLYSLDVETSGQNPTLLTDPDYDVLGAPSVVAKQDVIYFSANAKNPYESEIIRLNTSNGKWNSIAGIAGQNTVYPSPDGTRLIVRHSNDVTPPDLYMVSAKDADTRRITTSPPAEFAQFDWVTGEYVTFPSKIDDYELSARILKPRNLVAGKRYPVIFGPVYSNTVRNRWGGLYSSIQQLMVQKGYIVVQVDMRGSTGYGRDFREEFLADFAGNDIEDLVSAVSFMKTLPYVDTERFGIWGSSYGGTLTVYTLLQKPGLFRAGVAAAAAVDPHFFGPDDIAIVRDPESEPELFQRTAARLASNLEDHLLIIHGMQDQVVPFKTALVLAEELMKSGKDFDFAFAPAATHGWTRETHYARYLLGKLLAHFDRYLMPPVSPEPTS